MEILCMLLKSACLFRPWPSTSSSTHARRLEIWTIMYITRGKSNLRPSWRWSCLQNWCSTAKRGRGMFLCTPLIRYRAQLPAGARKGRTWGKEKIRLVQSLVIELSFCGDRAAEPLAEAISVKHLQCCLATLPPSALMQLLTVLPC